MLESSLPIHTQLRSHGFLIADGGLATELERRGFDLNDKLWSAKILIENPAAIYDVHKTYLQSGADIITTSSYQASLQGLAAKGYGKQTCEKILRQSVELAISARDSFWENLDATEKSKRIKPLVAASVGSYGAYLANGAEYTGNYDIGIHELKEFHRERVAILSSAGADLLAFETIPSLEEGKAIVELLSEFRGVCAWISFSCKDNAHCSHGEKFEECAKLANGQDQIVAVGVNCTAPKHISGLIRAAKAVTKIPLIVYPNSGEGWDSEQKQWLPSDKSQSLSDMAIEWVQEGCSIIGGCCRTTPEDILELSNRLRAEKYSFFSPNVS
eukprot:Phypoly_transcript_12544.p1 GENE.Phypoly_transcript_12544~~Phypoly_transcript_12544.p1  ORF type:complete len:329 (-),score=39.77 Phypoly_transcript_12544:105-1091(-)